MSKSDKPDFKDHFSGHAKQYAASRPTYPPALYDWLAALLHSHQHAWDVATGNGQAAVELAQRFTSVTASDASAEQLKHAVAHPRIRYVTARAEDSPLEDGSADLITVAQAVHWFDMHAFNREVERVLKPGGVVAVWVYGNVRVTPEIDAIEQRFYDDIVGDYWSEERRHIDNGLRDIELPYPLLEAPSFEMTAAWVPSQFTAYIGTWSAVQRYRRERREDPLHWLKQELLACWGAGERRKVSWPLHLKVARKPE